VKLDITFALFFGNRGFFPESLVASAKEEMIRAVHSAGFSHIMPGNDFTRYGAVETFAEGKKYAAFLENNKGKFDGVILCLPNFGDENGAVYALKDAGVPVLIQAYPDEIGKMDFNSRRDAFCGKFSIMDLFVQFGVSFSSYMPHVAHPLSEDFSRQLKSFGAVCRTVKQMKNLRIGAIGARTTAFKSIRYDELALQKSRIDIETLDLSEILLRVKSIGTDHPGFKERKNHLLSKSNWRNVPSDAIETHTKLSLVFDEVIHEYSLDAVSIRCWIELEKEIHIAPCVLIGDLNERGIAAACELDICNTVAMQILKAASGAPAALLDWNNNYGSCADKCILFHCGPVAFSLMAGTGEIVDHPMFAKTLGPGKGWGPNTGRIKPTPMTFMSVKTVNGKIHFYTGEGDFTDDNIEKEFFGCAGVAHIENLQKKLLRIGQSGYRHHVSVCPAWVAEAVREASTRYLGFTETILE